MDRTLTYTVSIEESDLRADQFLSRRGFSSHLLTRLRKNMEHLLINGTPSRTNTPLHEGDILTVHIVEEHSSYHVPPVKLPLSIVYEDEDILVANKPARMPIHPSMDNYYNSLANALAWYYRDSGNFIFRCTNRLDRDTSGLTVIAKNMLSSAVLSDMAVRHAITREYLAIVRGVVTPASGTITAPLSRKPGSIIERCVDFEHGERAVTHFRLILVAENIPHHFAVFVGDQLIVGGYALLTAQRVHHRAAGILHGHGGQVVQFHHQRIAADGVFHIHVRKNGQAVMAA